MRIWQKEGDSLSSNVFPRKTFRQLTGLVRQTRRVWVMENLDALIRALMPRQFHGPNGMRVCRNMANGGSAMRTFARRDAPAGSNLRALWEWARFVGAVPRVMRSRTALWIVGYGGSMGTDLV